MSETETETRDGRRPAVSDIRLVQVDAETLRQLRSDRARYKGDRDDAWARCAAGECESAQLERERADRLRGVVEAVQALADEWATRDAVHQRDQVVVVGCGLRLRDILASVPSSGETGERAEAFVELLPPDVGHNLRHFGPGTTHDSGDGCDDCRPERIPHAPASPEPTGADEGVREPRLFRLVRDRDISGVSGTGLVAWGVEFPDGRVATRWNAEVAQTCAWDSMEHVQQVHGHGGATRVEWLTVSGAR